MVSSTRPTDNTAFEYTARAGFAASGVLHLIVAYIILRIALGSGGNADQSGALATLAGQTGGTVMLWITAVGLLRWGFGGWPRHFLAPNPASDPVAGRTTSGLEAREVARAGHREFRDRLFGAVRFAMGSGQPSSQQNAGLSAQLMQSGLVKPYSS